MATETEVRFLEIDKKALVKKLRALGATDLGEKLLKEVIIYDKDLDWKKENKFIRVRQNGEEIKLTYKHHTNKEKGEAKEIEFKIDDLDSAVAFVEVLGFQAVRHQEKKRHTLKLGSVIFDIDTWPKIPTYVELEGPSLKALESAAKKVGLDWQDAVYEDAASVIENIYHIPVRNMRWFTFKKFELPR